ncbi:MAG: hypothetical protein ACXVHS_04345 [Methanobacterium sp.]
MSQQKSFFYGQLTGIVGVLLVMFIQPIVSYVLGFVTVAMIFVTVTHLIPDILKKQNTIISNLFGVFDFALMMIIDITLE